MTNPTPTDPTHPPSRPRDAGAAPERRVAGGRAVGWLQLTSDGRILDSNEALARMLDHRGRDDLKGRLITSFLEDSANFERCAAAIEAGDEGHFEIEMIRRDGSVLWAVVHALPGPGEGGLNGTILATVVDASEHHNAEEARDREHDYFGALLRNATDLITTLDSEGRITFQSPSSQPVLGYEPWELEQQKVFELIHPDDLGRAAEALRCAFETGDSRDLLRIRLRHRDGSWRHLEARGRALSGSPAVPEIVVNSRDVTERVAMEQALRASEERYRTFFREALSGNYVTTAEGRILDCNPAFCRIFAFDSHEQALETSVATLYRDPVDRDRVLRVIAERGRVEGLELALRRRDGAPVHAVAHIAGDFDDAGQLVGMRGYLLDETARRNVEEQLRHSQKMEAVGRLAGGIAHDFNNLLTTILGYSQLLLRRVAAKDPRHQSLSEIRRAAERAASLTGQLLAFSRRQVMQPRVLDLNVVVADMEKMLRRVVGEDVQIVSALEQDTPRVQADPGQLEQVIVNLVVNARDAMPEGGRITLTTQLVEIPDPGAAGGPGGRGELRAGRYALLTVTDTGTGMDAETRGRIFEPFFTTKDPGRGTGLGLSTAYGIVRQSEGHIAVDSEPGCGSTFRVYLPAVEHPADASGAAPAAAELPHGTETVLLVEDEASVARLAAEVLRGQGYRVLMAADGIEAQRIVEEHREGRIHLLLADVVMPEMSGRELAAWILERHAGTRVLLTSGYPDVAVVHQGASGSGIEFIAKPYAPETLLLKVREVLDRDDPVASA